MKLTQFYDLWRHMRFWAVAIVVVIMTILAMKGYAHTLDMEYTGPGSDADQLDRCYQDRQNERSYEKEMQERDMSPREQERAREYERDHAA